MEEIWMFIIIIYLSDTNYQWSFILFMFIIPV